MSSLVSTLHCSSRFLLSSQSQVLRTDMRDSRTGVLRLHYPEEMVGNFTKFFYGGMVEDDHPLNNVSDYLGKLIVLISII